MQKKSSVLSLVTPILKFLLHTYVKLFKKEIVIREQLANHLINKFYNSSIL